MRSMDDVDSDSDSDGPEKRDAEVTLGMASLLGIFFGLVVLCGAFFGFGYSVGKRFVPASSASATHALKTTNTSGDGSVGTNQPSQTVSQAAKPSADGQEMRSGVGTSGVSAAANPEAPRAPKKATPSTAPVDSVGTGPVARLGGPEPPSRSARDAAALAGDTAASARPSERSPSSSAFPDYMVQIAAISRPADGDALIAALRKRGYKVSGYTEPQDKLLHVQIGPFSTRADANAMRQKLLADGYNAIIK